MSVRDVERMLGTFPKAFTQVAISQGYSPMQQLSKCAIISQATTSQACPSRSARTSISALGTPKA